MNHTFLSITQAIRRLAAGGDIPSSLTKKKLTPTTRIAELGLDSLGQLLLIEEISRSKARYVPDDVFENLVTLEDLALALDKYVSPAPSSEGR